MTEKSSQVLEKGVYVFRVAPGATKGQVKKSVEDLFSVKVDKVNILTRVGKKRFFKRRAGHTSASRRAYIRLKEGTINLEGGF
jgi:large subunit ribosomal protein L23